MRKVVRFFPSLAFFIYAAKGDGEPSGAADDDLTMSARVGGDTTDEEAASSARMPARPHENIRVEFAYRRKKPIDAGRDAARTWVTLVIAGVKRAIEVAIVAMARRGKSESAGYRESELDCVLLAARIASRAMEATADFSDRIRDGRLHLGLWTLRREMIVRGLVSKVSCHRRHAIILTMPSW